MVIYMTVIETTKFLSSTNTFQKSVSDQVVDMQSLGFDSFDDSFSFMFGTFDQDFIWFDNPYIKLNVYEINENESPKISENIVL